MKTSSSLREFAWKRFLRIYPALAVCAIIGGFVIAPFFSELGIREYLSSFYGVKYVAKVLLLYNVHAIPTVKFSETEIQSVNGSLWTIASEIYCYIMLFFMAVLEIIVIPIALFGLFAGSVLLAWFWVVHLPFTNTTVNLFTVPSFCAGVAMFLIHARFGMSRIIALVCLAGLVLVAPTGYLVVLFPILGAYPLIYLGTSNSIFLGRATRFGDLSYGTYLYGWPVEQIVRSVAGPSLTGYGLFLISLPLAAACGWLLWHLVEKRALALKSLVARTPQKAAENSPAARSPIQPVVSLPYESTAWEVPERSRRGPGDVPGRGVP